MYIYSEGRVPSSSSVLQSQTEACSLAAAVAVNPKAAWRNARSLLNSLKQPRRMLSKASSTSTRHQGGRSCVPLSRARAVRLYVRARNAILVDVGWDWDRRAVRVLLRWQGFIPWIVRSRLVSVHVPCEGPRCRPMVRTSSDSIP